VTFHCSLEPWIAESDPLYVLLPLALAGFATAIVFGLQWLAGLLFSPDQSFERQSISKGALR
jgi:hypothetical protein